MWRRRRRRDLQPGDVLDGEGGYTVWGRLMLAEDSMNLGAVPIGLAHGATLKNPVKEGCVVTWSDLVLNLSLRGSLLPMWSAVRWKHHGRHARGRVDLVTASPLAAYRSLLEDGKINPDPIQSHAMASLQALGRPVGRLRPADG